MSSADKPTAALTVFALVMASVTIWVSMGASEETSRQTERALEITQNTALKTHRQTERSLKMTELTLEITETELKTRDIKERLDRFYSPLNYYLVSGPAKTRWYPESFHNIGFYKYLATDRTSKQFELFKDISFSHNRPESDLLTQYVKEETESLENELKGRKEDIDSLEKELKKLKENPNIT